MSCPDPRQQTRWCGALVEMVGKSDECGRGEVASLCFGHVVPMRIRGRNFAALSDNIVA